MPIGLPLPAMRRVVVTAAKHARFFTHEATREKSLTSTMFRLARMGRGGQDINWTHYKESGKPAWAVKPLFLGESRRVLLAEDSEMKSRYLAYVAKQSQKLRLDFCPDKFGQELSELDPQAQQLVTVPTSLDPFKGRFNALLSKFVPFIYPSLDINGYYLPSFELIKIYLKQVAPNSFEWMLVKGLVSDDAFLAMHQARQHPLATYDSGTKDALVVVHDYITCPLGAFLHDVWHQMMIGMLSKGEQDYILDELIPYLQNQASLNVADKVYANVLIDLCYELSDFNLTHSNGYITDIELYIEAVVSSQLINQTACTKERVLDCIKDSSYKITL